MAELVLAADMRGIYETLIPANEPTTLRVDSRGLYSRVEIIVHDAESPLYIAEGGTATIAGTNTIQVLPRSWDDLPAASNAETTFTMVSATQATISVYRR